MHIEEDSAYSGELNDIRESIIHEGVEDALEMTKKLYKGYGGNLEEDKKYLFKKYRQVPESL